LPGGFYKWKGLAACYADFARSLCPFAARMNVDAGRFASAAVETELFASRRKNRFFWAERAQPCSITAEMFSKDVYQKHVVNENAYGWPPRRRVA
jgi:hypothetical protein